MDHGTITIAMKLNRYGRAKILYQTIAP